MSEMSRRAMLGASGGLIAGGLLKTQADAFTVAGATTGAQTAGAQTAQADPTKMSASKIAVTQRRALCVRI